MREIPPEHPHDFRSGPSPYLAWLLSLSPEERLRVNAEAAILARHVADLLTVLRQMRPQIATGLWLHALGRVWQDLESSLYRSERHDTSS